MIVISQEERDIARAAIRRCALAELTPAELDAESDRWLHHLALLRGDLKAHDVSELPEETIQAGIAYAEHRLEDVTRQLRRYVRAKQTSKVGLTADFRAIKYVDLVGLAETLTSQRAVKSGSRHRIVCPFHDDTRPSLVIYPPGGGWWCPVCHRGGQDAASFCAELFACSQVEGLRWVEHLADGVRVAS